MPGDLEPTNGEARRSHTLRVGRYAQHFVDALQMDENPVEYLLRKYPQARARACDMASLLAFSLSGIFIERSLPNIVRNLHKTGPQS